MKKEDYIKTLEVCGHSVDLGLDDCGQCYYIEWIDNNGEKKETGLGTYNTHYMEEIYSLFDGRYHELIRKELFGELSDGEAAEMEHYYEIFNKEYESECQR